MSGCSYNNFTRQENLTFVQLLSKYKNIFKTLNTQEGIIKKNEAAQALAVEFKKICSKELSILQVFRKVHSIKQHLKEKHCKNFSTCKQSQSEYLDWEQLFFELWIENENTILESNDNFKDFMLNFKAGTAFKTSTQNCKTKSADKKHFNDADRKQRAVLISQIKALKMHEIGAIAEGNMNKYKLIVLRRKNSKKTNN